MRTSVLMVEGEKGTVADCLRTRLATGQDDLQFEVVRVTLPEVEAICSGNAEFDVLIINESAAANGSMEMALRLLGLLVRRFSGANRIYQCAHTDCAAKFLSVGTGTWLTFTVDLPSTVAMYAREAARLRPPTQL